MWVASCFVFDQNIPELFSYSVKIFRFEPQKLKHARLSINFTCLAQIIEMVSLFYSIIYYFTLFYSFVRISTCLISEQLVSSGLWTLFYLFFSQGSCTRVKFVLLSICGNTVSTGIYLTRWKTKSVSCRYKQRLFFHNHIWNSCSSPRRRPRKKRKTILNRINFTGKPPQEKGKENLRLAQ